MDVDNEPPKTARWRFDRSYRDHTALNQHAGERARAVAVDHIGGNARATTSATLQLPLPVPQIGGLQFHGLIIGSAGALVDQVRPSLLKDFGCQARASVAFGVGTPLPCGGFLGLTFAQPLLARPGDEQRRVQFSLSFGSIL